MPMRETVTYGNKTWKIDNSFYFYQMLDTLDELAHWVKEAREYRKLSLEEVAEKSNTTAEVIADIEAGKAPKDLPLIRKVLKIVEVHPYSLPMELVT